MKADEVRLYALRGGLKKQAVCYTHFLSNKVFRGDHYIVWVKKSGSYKITGSNFVNNAYCDIRRIYGYVQRYVRRGGKGNYSCTRDFAEWRNIYRFAEGIHHLPDSRRGYLLHH